MPNILDDIEGIHNKNGENVIVERLKPDYSGIHDMVVFSFIFFAFWVFPVSFMLFGSVPILLALTSFQLNSLLVVSGLIFVIINSILFYRKYSIEYILEERQVIIKKGKESTYIELSNIRHFFLLKHKGEEEAGDEFVISHGIEIGLKKPIKSSFLGFTTRKIKLGDFKEEPTAFYNQMKVLIKKV